MAVRRNADGYSHSISPSRLNPSNSPTSSRRYPNNYYGSAIDINKAQPTTYQPSYRPYGNNNETYRLNDARYNLSANNRVCSYDDLLNEPYRSQSSIYNSRNTNQYRPQQTLRRDQYYDYDYDEDELIVKSTDLPARHEQEMVDIVRAAFRKSDITNQRELAGYLKRAVDKRFSPCWHCIVGRQFSSYVTHEMNGFIYFTKGALSILLFRSGL